jgi:uncharacterized cupredoxin-like copper-binding protein
MKPTTLHFSMALAASLVAGAAAGHDDKSEHHGHAAASEAPYGRAADPARATRTIAIDMSDELRFTPAQVSVQKGQVVRFVVKNSGKLEHEFVLGTLPELREHAQMMRQHPGMEHDALQMAHVAPGKARSITWQFIDSGEFFYGCLVPGHFEAGMLGKVVVR